jgi:uncharacterized protein (DUF2252 family)
MTSGLPTLHPRLTHHTSVDERAEMGRAGREAVPRASHNEWSPRGRRPDPVGLLEQQNKERVPWLVPLRHARMRVSPFTFYRGTARIMASDLASTAASGLQVQLGGDAHLSNFGGYASPSRQLVFDQNDFDETLPGPWEWDVKRLATSFMVGTQALGFTSSQCRKVTARSVEAYRRAMTRFGQMGYLDLWYEHMTTDDVGTLGGLGRTELNRRMQRFNRTARSHTSMQALEKMAEEVDGHYRIRNQAPVLFPLRDLPKEYNAPAMEAAAFDGFERYKTTLSDERRRLLNRFTPIDVGVKVVGVGSVGTRCLIMLLEGRDRGDPLFLQAKEAGASVLEEHLVPSEYDNHGRRVVEGQRQIQAESDIFLGWAEGGPEERHFYFRQLRDWKGSVEVGAGTPPQAAFYADLCGMTLARGHARSGDPVSISAYLGKGDSFDRAVTAFSERYALQNQRDYDAFQQAISDGRIEASPSEEG